MPTDIVVDAMGSDKAPEPEVRGAVLAARQYGVRVHLVGPEDILRPLLRQTLRGSRLPVFIVLARRRYLRVGLDCGVCPHAGVYAETFALWLIAYLGLTIVARLFFDEIAVPVRSGAAI